MTLVPLIQSLVAVRLHDCVSYQENNLNYSWSAEGAFCFPPYIEPVSIFTSQMALLGFLSSLFVSHLEQVSLWSRIIPVQSERERKHPPHRDLDLNPWSPDYWPSVPSIRPWHQAQVASCLISEGSIHGHLLSICCLCLAYYFGNRREQDAMYISLRIISCKKFLGPCSTYSWA